MTAATLIAVGLVSVPVAAQAAGPAIAQGVVRADSNANGVRDTSTAPGRDDKGIAGAIVELECSVDGVVLGQATTNAAGAYELGEADLTTPLTDCV